MYMIAKNLHLTLITISVLFFTVRFILALLHSPVLSKKIIKVLPHAIDTLLLASAIWLCVLISQYPIVNQWVTFKVLGIILYIVFGLLTLKWAKNNPTRIVGFLLALGTLGVTAKIALTKTVFFL